MIASTVAHHDAARSCGRFDDIDGAVTIVRDVVVDHDQLTSGARRRHEPTETVEGAAVEGDHDIGRRGKFVRRPDALESDEFAVVRGDHERFGERRDGLDA